MRFARDSKRNGGADYMKIAMFGTGFRGLAYDVGKYVTAYQRNICNRDEMPTAGFVSYAAFDL